MQGLSVDPVIASAVAGLILANIGALVSAYVSIRVRIAKLEVIADAQSKDLNGIGKMVRSLALKTKE